MSNVFDQWDATPPGVAPQRETAPTAGNPFDRFDAEPATGAAARTPPAAAPPQPSLYTSVYENPMLGAAQGAVPDPNRYGKPVSTDLFRNDAGEVLFRDQSGNVIPTDSSKHVILYGPDNKQAVYQRTEATAESPVVGVSRVLTLGLGPSAPTTAAGAARLAPTAEATIPKLKEAATAIYESPEILARQVHPGEVASAFDEISPQLRRFDPKVTGRLSDTISDLGSSQQGITVGDLENASRRLGFIADEAQMTASGPKATADAAAATIVKKQLDGVIRRVAPEFAEADKNYGAARATETIVNRADKAEVLARGNDIAGRMATQATQLLANPRYLRGFTPDEVQQLREISQGSVAGDRVRTLNSWLTGKLAAIGPAAAGLVGYQHSGLMGAIGSMAGTAALEATIGSGLTKLGNYLSANQINRLSQSIRARSPLGQQLAQNAQEWEATRQAMHSTPNSMTLTALARSSRDLSNALRSIGVEVGPAQLMRGAKPDENQQNVPGPPGQ